MATPLPRQNRTIRIYLSAISVGGNKMTSLFSVIPEMSCKYSNYNPIEDHKI